MPPNHRDVSLPMVEEPRYSKFREDFDAPFIESIVAPAVAPSTGTEDAKSSTQTEASQNLLPFSTILKASRSWSSGSRMSATSATLKRWNRGPLKKLKDSAAKLWRSEKTYYAGFDDSGWPRDRVVSPTDARPS